MSTNITNLEDFTKCYICMGKLVEPTMCPHCNKLSCLKCIQKWLTERKSSCPHCRTHLKYSQIVHCRFINDLASMIESFSNKKQVNENCSEHKIPLLYYCTQCLEPLCSDCFMFGKKHKDHDIKHLDLIYKNHLQLIQTETKDLQSKLDNLNLVQSHIEEKITAIKHAKQERSIELEELFGDLKKKLDSLMREKLLSLIKTKTVVSDKIDEFEKKKVEINKKLMESQQSELISNSENYVKLLKALTLEEETNRESLNVCINFESEITPPYESTTFTIKEYKKLVNCSTAKDTIYSTELLTNGLVWRLKIYPNGNGVAKGEFISIFLELIDGLAESSRYFYKIELVNFFDNKPNYFREFSSDFQNGECWGYNRFYKIDLLEKEGFIDPRSGSLCLKYYVRPLTYSQLCRDQKNFIDKMESLLKKREADAQMKIKIEQAVLKESEPESKPETKEIIEDQKELVKREEADSAHIALDVKELNKVEEEKKIEKDVQEKEKEIVQELRQVDEIHPKQKENPTIIDPIFSTNVQFPIIELKAQDEENPLLRSENVNPVKREKEAQRSSSVIDGLYSVNKENEDLLLQLGVEKINRKVSDNGRYGYDLNMLNKKSVFNPSIEFDCLKNVTEDKLDFLQLADNQDLSGDLQFQIRKQSVSSEMSSDIFDKPNVHEEANVFKENFKQNLQNSNNFNLRGDYEDPFSKKLKLSTGASSRKDNPTENRINDMMASLFPEGSHRNRFTKPSPSILDNNNALPSSQGLAPGNNFGVYEKNKFSNYEKLRYMLKESRVKSGKKGGK